jgi:hypothetical protein
MDTDRYKSEARSAFGQPEHSEVYQGHRVEIMAKPGGYAIRINGESVGGNFPGVTTAMQRARILIDRLKK